MDFDRSCGQNSPVIRLTVYLRGALHEINIPLRMINQEKALQWNLCSCPQLCNQSKTAVRTRSFSLAAEPVALRRYEGLHWMVVYTEVKIPGKTRGNERSRWTSDFGAVKQITINRVELQIRDC